MWKLGRVFGVSMACCVTSAGAALPFSARSVEVQERTEPRLKASFTEAGLEWGNGVHFRAYKDEAVFEVWVRKGKRYELWRRYPILARGIPGCGPKTTKGDFFVPEGFYRITASELRPNSQYHLGLGVDYPNEEDRKLGRTGAEIVIHGSDVSIGCIALGDSAIEEVWTVAIAAMNKGQASIPVHIFPFRMDAAAMRSHEGHFAIGYWKRLEPAYRQFEQDRSSPEMLALVKREYMGTPAEVRRQRDAANQAGAAFKEAARNCREEYFKAKYPLGLRDALFSVPDEF
ncbi:MAG: hypothetical protein RL318_1150 [Fibrobacterota bacterium]|jgi:murein L,D-transpeptidase YafK